MKPLTTNKIARKNLAGNRGRTIALKVIVSIMAFALFGGLLLTQSLENGMSGLEARMGAEITVVPLDGEDAYVSHHLGGMPVNIYLDGNIVEQIAATQGVEQVTSQLYLAAYPDADCCVTLLQIVGFDQVSDFIVQPWINEIWGQEICTGQIIVGSRVANHPYLEFFEHNFRVVARLKATGTGLDTTVFMNMEEARQLAFAAQESGYVYYDVDMSTVVSIVMVGIAPGYDIDNVIANIQSSVPSVGVVARGGILSNVSDSLSLFTGIIRVITIVFGIVAVLVLGALFALISNGRKKEFAVLRVIGATRKKLGNIVLAEAARISMSGGVFGVILAAAVILPFGRVMGEQLGMPMLLPSLSNLLLLLVFSLIISIAIAPLSATYSAFKISRAETYATMREGE